MLIWIIDEEWTDYELEKEVLEKEFPGVEIKRSSYDYKDDLVAFGHKADGILAQVYADIPKETIDQLEHCQGIAAYGGGFDRIDVEACKAKGIQVTNIQGYCAEDLADYVVAAIYDANKKISAYAASVNDQIEQGQWGATAVTELPHRISEQSLLIIGFGTIGQEVNKKAQAIGLHVMAYDEFLSKEEILAEGVEKVSWEEGLKRADYVSVNLKGIDANANKIGAQAFDLMKKSSYIINTARGKIINEADLIDAVRNQKIKGAILDVIKKEPPVPGDPILNCPGIKVTPHVSYISVESLRALKEFALQNLISMLRGEKPRDFVC